MGKSGSYETWIALIPDMGPKEMCLREFRNTVCQSGCMPVRHLLLSVFDAYATGLYEAGLRGKLWVDGSFMSVKPEPEDVDFTLITHESHYSDYNRRSLPVRWDANTRLQNLPEGLHGFIVPLVPPTAHPLEIREAQKGYAGWKKWWSEARDFSPKGFASLDLEEFAR